MRTFVLLVEIAVVGAVSVWFFFQEGRVELYWGQNSIDIQLGLAFLTFVILFLLVYFVISVWRFIILLPSRMFDRAQKMRPEKGLKALTQAAISTSLDEYNQARNQAQRFERYLGDNPVNRSIIAYNFIKEGKYDQALAECERMKKDDDGTTLAWALQARIAILKGEDSVALEYLSKLFTLHESSPWVVSNLIKYAFKTELYEKVELALKKAEKLNLYTRQIIDEANALIHFERSKKSDLSLEEKEQLLERAYRLASEIPQIAIQYAKILRMRDKDRRARKVLENAWATRPYSGILDEYLALESSTDQKDIMADVDRLMAYNSSDLQSYLTMAEFALKHQHWGRARAALHDAEEKHGINQDICHYMAQLELMEHGDQAKYREWMEKALNAPVVEPFKVTFETIFK